MSSLEDFAKEVGINVGANLTADLIKFGIKNLVEIKLPDGPVRIVTLSIITYTEIVPFDKANKIVNSILSTYNIKNNVIDYNGYLFGVKIDWHDYENCDLLMDTNFQDVLFNNGENATNDLIYDNCVDGLKIRITPNISNTDFFKIINTSYELLNDINNKINREQSIEIPRIFLQIFATEKICSNIYKKISRSKDNDLIKYSRFNNLSDEWSSLFIFLNDRLTIKTLEESIKKRRWLFW